MELKTYTDQLSSIDLKNDKQNTQESVKARIFAEAKLGEMKARLDKWTISQKDFDVYFTKVKELMTKQDADIGNINEQFEKAKNDIIREAAKKTKEGKQETLLTGTFKKMLYLWTWIEEDMGKNSDSKNFSKWVIDEILSLPEVVELLFSNSQARKQLLEWLRNISWAQIKDSFPSLNNAYEWGRATVFTILLLTWLWGMLKSGSWVLAKRLASAPLLKGMKKTTAEATTKAVAAREAAIASWRWVWKVAEETAEKVTAKTAEATAKTAKMATQTSWEVVSKVTSDAVGDVLDVVTKTPAVKRAKEILELAKESQIGVKTARKELQDAINKSAQEIVKRTIPNLEEIVTMVRTLNPSEEILKSITVALKEGNFVKAKNLMKTNRLWTSTNAYKAIKVAEKNNKKLIEEVNDWAVPLVTEELAQKTIVRATKKRAREAAIASWRWVWKTTAETWVKTVGDIVIQWWEEVAKKSVKKWVVKWIKELPWKMVDWAKKTASSIREARVIVRESKMAVKEAKDALKQAKNNLKQAKKSWVGNKIEAAQRWLQEATDTLRWAKDALNGAKKAASIKRRMAGAVLDVAKKPLVYWPALATVAAWSMEHKVRAEAWKVLDEVWNDDIPSAPLATPAPVESQETTSPVTPPEGQSGTPVPSPEWATPGQWESSEDTTEPTQPVPKPKKKSSKWTSEPKGKEWAYAPLTPEQIKEGIIGTVATRTWKLNVRDENGKVVWKLNKWEQVNLTGESKDINGRKYVKVKSSDGKEWFVAADFIKVDAWADNTKKKEDTGKKIYALAEELSVMEKKIGDLSKESKAILETGKPITVADYTITQWKVGWYDYDSENDYKGKNYWTETFPGTFELRKEDDKYILKMKKTGVFKDDIKDMGTTMPTKWELGKAVEEMRSAKQTDWLKNYAVTTHIYEVKATIKDTI